MALVAEAQRRSDLAHAPVARHENLFGPFNARAEQELHGTLAGADPEQPREMKAAHTDGASEVWNRDGDELGEEGVIKLFNGTRGATAEDMQKDIMNDISAFAGGHFADDVTMLVITLPPTRG